VKIAILNTLYPPIVMGGAEKSVSLLAEALVRRGHAVTVLTLHPEAEERREIQSGVVVHRLPMDNVYWPFDTSARRSAGARLRWHLGDLWNRRAAGRVARILAEVQPDLLHSNNVTGFSVAVWREARRLSLPIVHTLRDYSLMCRRATLFRNGHTCASRCLDCTTLSWSARRACAAVDEVVSNSRFVLDIHRDNGFFADTPGHVVFNIMDGVSASAPREIAAGAPLTFGFIGKIDRDKGIEVVLEATRRLKNPDWRLLVAGRGKDDYVAELRRRHPDPRIEWLGFVRSDDFFAAVDVTLVSSIWHEPLPRTLIESIAHGRATICAEAGGIPEIAHLSDLIGTYAPTDAVALAALMDAALDAPERRSPRPSSAPADLDAFSETRVAESYLAVYRSALARHGRPETSLPSPES